MVGVVLVHGLRASASMWRRQVQALSLAGAEVRTPDLPGHGRRRGEGFTLEAAVAAVEEAAGDLAAAGRPVLVVGESLGGYVSLHMAARTPLPLAGVVAAACCARPTELLLGGYRAIARAVGALPDRGAWLNGTMARLTLTPEGLADLAEGGFALDVMEDTLRSLSVVRPVEDLRMLDELPVWLVNGAWDHFRVNERAYLAACGNGRLVVVPQAKHLVSLDAPVAFNRVLLEAVADVAATTPVVAATTPVRGGRGAVSAGRRAPAAGVASAPAG